MILKIEISKSATDYWWNYTVKDGGDTVIAGSGGYSDEDSAKRECAWAVYRIVNCGPSGELAFAIEEAEKYRLDFMDLEVELAEIIDEAKKGLAANKRGEVLKAITERLEKATKKI